MPGYSTLKRTTPLKAKTTLKRKSAIRSSFSGCRKSSITVNKPKKTEKKVNKKKPGRKTYSYKPSYKYWSIFTGDLKACAITGDRSNVHVHHIFGAANKANSERYGFLLPLRADWHDMADYGIHFNRQLDLKYKCKCQEYWLQHYGTEQEFINTFGKWWVSGDVKSRRKAG